MLTNKYENLLTDFTLFCYQKGFDIPGKKILYLGTYPGG